MTKYFKEVDKFGHSKLKQAATEVETARVTAKKLLGKVNPE